MGRVMMCRASMAVASAAAVAGVLFASPASAAVGPSSAPGAHRVTLRMAMRVVGIDRKVAEAHGYKVVRRADGTEVSVPKNGVMRPNGGDTIYGNCGFSYVNLDAKGGAAANFSTGFHVIHGAVDYKWRVRITDPGGVSAQLFGGPLANRQDWTSGWKTLHLTRGRATATVVTASSFAVLNNGTVCYSGGPGIAEIIY